MKYSIDQAASITGMSKDTLRYYDKQKIVQPARGENNYRYYTEELIMQLKYVKLLKYSGLSLSVISQIINNRISNKKENLQTTISILNERRDELQELVVKCSEMIKIIDESIVVLKTDGKKKQDIDLFSKSIYSKIFSGEEI